MVKKETKSGLVPFLFYTIVAGLYALSLFKEYFFTNRDNKLPEFQPFKTFGGRLKFLTIIDLYIQLFYFSLCALNILIGLFYGKKSKKDSGPLAKICNFIYTSLTFPVGILVTVTFWAIYAVDRNLIFPEALDKIIPPWQNHLMHTLPLVSAIVDNFLTMHYYNKSFLIGVLPTIFFGICYMIWVFVIAHYGGFWVYPVLQVLRPVMRGVFFLVLFVFVGFLYKLGEILNSKIWSETSNESKAPKKLIQSKVKKN